MSEPAAENQQPAGEEAREIVDRSAQDAQAGGHQAENQPDAQDETNGDGQTSNQTRIEKDVGTILAGLNQEQLASIVAAARASEAGNQGQSQSGDYPASSEAPLADLAGQAASALTSFASSFKRTTSVSDQEKLDDAPPPPGTEYQTPEIHDHGDARDSHNGEPKESHESATAAALASLGSLSSQQPDASLHAHDGEHGSPDSTQSGKRARGPELDRQRKDNHKEVERRRRSAISDGITQLSQIVPGCDAKNTNKSSIIVAAVRYIQDLKNNEASNIEKWTLEKLLMDQAMNDLTTQLDETRRENERLRAELGKTEPAPEKRSHEEETQDDDAAKRQKVD